MVAVGAAIGPVSSFLESVFEFSLVLGTLLAAVVIYGVIPAFFCWASEVINGG